MTPASSDAARTRNGKFLSLVLRHRPESIGLTLDPNGWADVDELIACAARHGRRLDRAAIGDMVATNDKQRFALSDDGGRIRAVQGHSLRGVDLELAEVTPPEVLFHGTVDRFVAAIRGEGLQPRQRQHVHLSADRETAERVGRRRGTPVVLTVAAGEMNRAGMVFHQAENGVWLTAAVPPQYLQFPDGT